MHLGSKPAGKFSEIKGESAAGKGGNYRLCKCSVDFVIRLVLIVTEGYANDSLTFI